MIQESGIHVKEVLYDVAPTKRAFEEYYHDYIKVKGYPTFEDITQGRYKDYNVIVNVSDEFYVTFASAVMQSGREYYWFPLCECVKDMGLTSIYGALWVLYQSYLRDKKVLLHCHAGANRSATVKECFYYMMTETHIVDRKIGDNTFVKRTNMFLANCGKHLPSQEFMETWLRKCRRAFDNPHKYVGGMLDLTIIETESGKDIKI